MHDVPTKELKNPKGIVTLNISSWQTFVLCRALQTHATPTAKRILIEIKDQVSKLGDGYEDLKELVENL